MVRKRSATLGILVIAVACHGDAGLTSDSTPPCPLKLGVLVTPAHATVSAGTAARFTAQAIVPGASACTATPVEGTFDWWVSDTSVASVSPDSGVVTGKKPGTTQVWARYRANPDYSGGGAVEVRP
ncbi:MAG: Ig-like domain-containing protein [Gemmatimonadaceae bacterium]